MFFGNVGRQTPTRSRTIGVGLASASLDLSFMSPGVLDPQLTFTRASVATYFDADGVLQTVGNDTPRWDYDPVTHALRGLLIEETRTNLLLNSAALSTQSVAVVTGPTYTLSFYGTGTIILSGIGTATVVGAGAFPIRTQFSFPIATGTLTLTVTGQVLNAQLEAGSFGTSWIPTTGVSATRAFDLISAPAGSWFDPIHYSLMSEFMLPFVPAPATYTGAVASLSDGTVANRVTLYAERNSSSFAGITVNVNASGGQVANAVSGANTALAVCKAAGSYDGVTEFVSGNGGAAASLITTNGFPVGVNSFTTGCAFAGSNLMNGWIRRVQYWPRVLSATELQAVTT